MFLGYAALGILAGVLVWRLVTETKGRSLEEIEADLQGQTERRHAHRHPRRCTAVTH